MLSKLIITRAVACTHVPLVMMMVMMMIIEDISKEASFPNP